MIFFDKIYRKKLSKEKMAKVFLLECCDKFNKVLRGPMYRRIGQSFIANGLSMMGDGYVERGKPLDR